MQRVQPSKSAASMPPAVPATPGAAGTAGAAPHPVVAKPAASKAAATPPAIPAPLPRGRDCSTLPLQFHPLSSGNLPTVAGQGAMQQPTVMAQANPARTRSAVYPMGFMPPRRPATPFLPGTARQQPIPSIVPQAPALPGPSAPFVPPAGIPTSQLIQQPPLFPEPAPAVAHQASPIAYGVNAPGIPAVTVSPAGHHVPVAPASAHTLGMPAATPLPAEAVVSPAPPTPAQTTIRLIPAETTRDGVRALLDDQAFTSTHTAVWGAPTQDRLAGLQVKRWPALLEEHYGVNLYTHGRVGNYSRSWAYYLDEAGKTGRGMTEEEYAFDRSGKETGSINHILPIAVAQHIVSDVTGHYISAQRQFEVLHCAKSHASTAFRVAKPQQAVQAGFAYADPFFYSLGQIAAQQAAGVGMIHGYSVAIIEENRLQEPARNHAAHAGFWPVQETQEEGRLAEQRKQALKLTLSMLGNDALEQTLGAVLRSVRDDLRAQDTPTAVRHVLADYHLKAMAQGNRYLRNIAFPQKNDFYANFALIVSTLMHQYQRRHQNQHPNEKAVVLPLLRKLHDSLVSPDCSLTGVLAGIEDIDAKALKKVHKSHYEALMKLTFNSAGNLRIGNYSLNLAIGPACDLPLNRDGKTPTPRGLRLWQAHYNYAPHRYLEDGVFDRKAFTRTGWGAHAPVLSSSKQRS